jgi:dTMP kinase
VVRPAEQNRGRLVVFEGMDGCGKSTQAALLASSLGALLTSEPGATSLGTELRSILLDGRDRNVSVRAEALLMAADRAEHVAEVIQPALADGRWVVCDRFTASTLAYQGYGRGIDLDELFPVAAFAARGVVPDLQILLDLPVDVARDRTKRADDDRLERLGRDFQARVRDGYLALASLDPEHWVVLDAAGTVSDIEEQIAREVTKRLGLPAQRAEL